MENLELQKRVKDLRIKQGLSQEELADKTGLSLRTIQRIENGESVPRSDTLKRIAIALKVSPDEVIEWREQEDKNILIIMNLSQLGSGLKEEKNERRSTELTTPSKSESAKPFRK